MKRSRNQISYQFSKPATAALVLLVAVVACDTKSESSSSTESSSSSERSSPAKSNEKILTKEIAEQFLENANSVDLSEFTAIENAAAASLSKHESWLVLTGLTSLSDAAAESLCKNERDLGLSLVKIPKSAAAILRQHPSFAKKN